MHAHSPNQTLLGSINIPVNTIESSQPVEKWYCLEPASSHSHTHTTVTTSAETATPLNSNGIQNDPSSTSSSLQQQLQQQQLSSVFNSTTSNSTSSLTTTQNFGKDSISIRIKAKYQSVDILPLDCYQHLIEVGHSYCLVDIF